MVIAVKNDEPEAVNADSVASIGVRYLSKSSR